MPVITPISPVPLTVGPFTIWRGNPAFTDPPIVPSFVDALPPQRQSTALDFYAAPFRVPSVFSGADVRAPAAIQRVDGLAGIPFARAISFVFLDPTPAKSILGAIAESFTFQPAAPPTTPVGVFSQVDPWVPARPSRFPEPYKSAIASVGVFSQVDVQRSCAPPRVDLGNVPKLLPPVFSSLVDFVRYTLKIGPYEAVAPLAVIPRFSLLTDVTARPRTSGPDAFATPWTSPLSFSTEFSRAPSRTSGTIPETFAIQGAPVVGVFSPNDARGGLPRANGPSEFVTIVQIPPAPVVPTTKDGGPSNWNVFPYTGAWNQSPDVVHAELESRQREEDEWFREYIRLQIPENDSSFLDRLAITQRFSEIPQDIQMVAGFQTREKWKTVAAGALIGVGVVLVVSSLGKR